MNLSDTVRKLVKDIAELTKLVMNIRATAGGGVTGGQNIGAGGVGVYHSIVANTMRFRTVNAASAQIAVSLDAVNNEVDIELGPHVHQAAGSGGQLDHGLALTGLGDDDHTQYVPTSGTRGIEAPLILKEVAEPASAAGYGKIWVSSADGLPYFKDDAGNICELCAGAGSGGPAAEYPFYKNSGTTRFKVADCNYAGVDYSHWAITSVGTPAAYADAYSSWRRYNGTTAVMGGLRTTTTNYVCGDWNCSSWWLIQTYGSVANQRIHCYCSSAGVVFAADVCASPWYGFVYSAPDSGNWLFSSKDAGGTLSSVDTGIACNTDTIYYMNVVWNGTSLEWYIAAVGSSSASGSKTTNLPLSSLLLSQACQNHSTTGTVYFYIGYMSLETN